MDYKQITKGSQEDADKLWADFVKSRSLENRNNLVMHYIYIVKYVVNRLVPTYQKHVDFDDLMSNGFVGLMDAVDKFDTTKDVKFETYATQRIRGAIVDQIRKQDWAPSHLRQKIKRIEEASERIEATEGKIPTERDIADYLQISEEEVRRTLDESHTFNLVSFEEIITDRLDTMAKENPSEIYEDKDFLSAVANLVDNLPKNEKLVVSMYYNDELTFKEIGTVLGLTESRVSQIHSKAMMRLRTKVKNIM